jgi:GWxTD domain-containing protein
MGIAPESKHDHCFKPPHSEKDAIRRLPTNARDWLAEDAIYLISPEERCAFLRLNTVEERELFIEQFWYRRSMDPLSLDYDFKAEFYRRIVFANEKYGSKFLAGWKTERGRIYVILGPPDSVDENTDRGSVEASPSEEVQLHRSEKWHYHYINGIGENAQIRFEYTSRYDDYVLPDADRDLVGQAKPNPDRLPVTLDRLELLVVASRPPKVRFKDLEAIVVSGIVRDQVKFSHRIEFAPATHATTLARINIQIPCEACAHVGQIAPSVAYPLFIRVNKPSGWVIATSELIADIAMQDRPDSRLSLDAHLDIPLEPGVYQLAIVAKNAATSEAGAVRTQLYVPAYQSLGAKN